VSEAISHLVGVMHLSKKQPDQGTWGTHFTPDESSPHIGVKQQPGSVSRF
jgi:hypothetical protein